MAVRVLTVEKPALCNDVETGRAYGGERGGHVRERLDQTKDQGEVLLSKFCTSVI